VSIIVKVCRRNAVDAVQHFIPFDIWHNMIRDDQRDLISFCQEFCEEF
jgi:formylmethanofuran dehydrogenase subunit D